MLQGKLTYSAIIAMLLVSLSDLLGLGVSEDEASRIAEALVMVILAGAAIYGRWRSEHGK